MDMGEDPSAWLLLSGVLGAEPAGGRDIAGAAARSKPIAAPSPNDPNRENGGH
jgi:hypothetical protein